MAAATTTMTPRRLFALAAVLVLAVCCLPAALAAAAAAAPQGKQYRVAGEDGWHVPPPENKDKYYDDWASNITFFVGDTLEFVYKNDSAVLRVSKAGYYHCNETAGDAAAAPRDGRTVFLLDAPGYAYFASADLQHCGIGERLAVTVLATAGPLPPPAPSPTSSSPWSPSAPGPWSWVLSPSSPAASSPSGGEHSAAAAALVVASSSVHSVVLAVAMAMAASFV